MIAGSPRGAIFVLHGIHDNKQSQIGVGKMLAKAGYRAILIDLRGHGRSSGEWLTYGVEDRKDLSIVLNALENKQLTAGRVGVIGPSYGAAVAIQWAASDKRVAAVVAISPFTSLKDVVPEYIQRYLPILWRAIPDSIISKGIHRAGEIGEFDPDQASPLNAMSSMKTPVLLIHGTRDRHISYHHSRKLHESGKSHSRLILIKGDDYYSIMHTVTTTLNGEIMSWFEQYLVHEKTRSAN